MFRLYWLPRKFSDHLSLRRPEDGASSIFYEKKRLPEAFAAPKNAVRLSRDGKPVAYARYLMISALALDTSSGECAAGVCSPGPKRVSSTRTESFSSRSSWWCEVRSIRASYRHLDAQHPGLHYRFDERLSYLVH